MGVATPRKSKERNSVANHELYIVYLRCPPQRCVPNRVLMHYSVTLCSNSVSSVCNDALNREV